MNGEASFCRFPACAAPPVTVTGMCTLHARVRISTSGSHVNDKHKDGGHG